MLAVDFKKAFNTMKHDKCLEALKRNGASDYITEMVRSFLANREMRVRIGSTLSDPRAICGDSPQGTLLGNLLFTLATNEIEDDTPQILRQRSVTPHPPPSPDATERALGCSVSTPIRIERSLSGLSDVSDINEHPYLKRCESTLQYDMSDSDMDTSEHGEPSYATDTTIPVNWKRRPMITVKFIDDLTAACQAYLPSSYQIFSQNKPARILHAKGLEDFYNTVATNANKVGLSVNVKKTQLLCVSSAVGCNPSSYINISGVKITSQATLKVLGFHISATPGMHEQIEQLMRAYRRRAWIIATSRDRDWMRETYS